MTFTATPYTLALFTAALISAVVVSLAWRRRDMPGGRHFVRMMGAAFLWTFASALESAAVGLPLKVLLAKVSFAGTSFCGPFFLLFILCHREESRKPSGKTVGALFVIPAVSTILAATNELHGLMWSGVTPSLVRGGNLVVFSHTPWFFLSIAYDNILVVIAFFLLLRSLLRSHALFKKQTFVILAGLSVFWVSFLFYITPLNPFPGLDTVAIGFSLSGLALMLGLRRFRLLDIIPVARDALVEKMADGLVLLDGRDRIVDINPAARRRFGLADLVVGRTVQEAFPEWNARLEQVRGRPEAGIEVMRQDGKPCFYDLRVTQLADRQGKPGGRLLLFRDVTERKNAELEKERLIGELRDALSDIKTLRGLLPICANCKKVRNDTGYWQNVEQYIEQHSEADFTHGLCPDCMKKLYPDLAEDEPR